MFTHPKSTLHVLHILMNLSSGHMTYGPKMHFLASHYNKDGNKKRLIYTHMKYTDTVPNLCKCVRNSYPVAASSTWM